MTRLVIGKNDLATVNPELASEWDTARNMPLTPMMVTAGSSRKVWWQGKCGHSWTATIASRNHGVGCPICARIHNLEKRKETVVTDQNRFSIRFPDQAVYWNIDKNNGVSPDNVSYGSRRVFWWKCSNNHEWQSSVKDQCNRKTCPFCSGNRVIQGVSDLVTSNPELIESWDYSKNTDVQPETVTAGSHLKVWWICPKCGYGWKTEIRLRAQRRHKCPRCEGKVLESGSNDLETLYPDLVKEWNYKKNGSLTPKGVRPGSHRKVWWICSKGHEWDASPNHRTSKDRGCPYCCVNPQVLSGVNDLATIHPELISEWNYQRNGDLRPEDYTANSNKSVWWICSKGHEWKTAINHRSNGSGCPKCASGMQTSFPEQAIYYYVAQAYKDAINGYTDIFKNHGMELDIYVPSLKIGVEYDGLAFHRTDKQIEREYKKYKRCKESGITLIRVRENTNNNDQNSSDYVLFINDSLNKTISELKLYLPQIGDVDIERDRNAIDANYRSLLSSNSLGQRRPDLAQEWNYARNGELTPDMFQYRSNRKVWWICSKNHEWQATIDSRVRGTGCPYCSNNKVLAGFNDLKSLRPDLMEEWHPTMNGLLDPTKLTPGSGKKAWWICHDGHVWQAEISSRNKGHGCPICSRSR